MSSIACCLVFCLISRNILLPKCVWSGTRLFVSAYHNECKVMCATKGSSRKAFCLLYKTLYMFIQNRFCGIKIWKQSIHYWFFQECLKQTSCRCNLNFEHNMTSQICFDSKWLLFLNRCNFFATSYFCFATFDRPSDYYYSTVIIIINSATAVGSFNYCSRVTCI